MTPTKATMLIDKKVYRDKKEVTLAKKNETIKIISDRIGVYIVENIKLDRFSVRADEVKINN